MLIRNAVNALIQLAVVSILLEPTSVSAFGRLAKGSRPRYRSRPGPAPLAGRQQQSNTPTPQYVIAQNYTGENFFVGWDFATGPDIINWGNVIWLDQPTANATDLISVNSAGNVIIRVDNNTVGTSDTYGRNSVYISSQASFGPGSLILFQALHMPYGCGVWPGFWSLGGNATNWPEYGEIDIIENVNAATTNQYSLHTTENCTHPPDVPGLTTETGALGNPDCWNMTLYNTGCVVAETKPNNYGASFAANGGGAYAVQWTTEAMSFWFFPRGNIPSDLGSDSPDPSSWGLPSGYYPQSSCNWDHFGPQALVLDIDLCGLWAGVQAIYNAGGSCSGVCTDLIHDPANFNNAYFEIEFVRVFVESNGTIAPIPTESSGSTATSLATPTIVSGQEGPGNGTGNGALSSREMGSILTGIGLAVALSVLALAL